LPNKSCKILYILLFSAEVARKLKFSSNSIVVGFDSSGNLLEILYGLEDDGSVNVFHAMKCRNIFLHLLDA